MAAAPKKRKRDLRGKLKQVVASEPSSSRGQVAPDDRLDVGFAGTLSNLLGRYGVHQDQFYEAFRVCNYCQRIVCNEISKTSGHACFIDLVKT